MICIAVGILVLADVVFVDDVDAVAAVIIAVVKAIAGATEHLGDTPAGAARVATIPRGCTSAAEVRIVQEEKGFGTTETEKRKKKKKKLIAKETKKVCRLSVTLDDADDNDDDKKKKRKEEKQKQSCAVLFLSVNHFDFESNRVRQRAEFVSVRIALEKSPKAWKNDKRKRQMV